MDLPIAIKRELKEDVVAFRPLPGGCINNSGIVEIASGERYFLKFNENVGSDFFKAEARGLEEMRRTSEVLVPEVVLVGDKFLLLGQLRSGPKDEKTLGISLAKLHKHTADKFGFYADNYIGSLPQKNTWSDNWGEFFYQNRLGVQVELGSSWVDSQIKKAFESKKTEIIDTLNKSQEPPSLLHGDLWSANVFYSNAGPYFIDPAVYYGNREADIAFSEMFGGFGGEFYRAYNSIWPLSPGYEQRKEIHNLYHNMTHANLFGGHYVEAVRRYFAI